MHACATCRKDPPVLTEGEWALWRLLASAREELDAAVAACGVDPRDWRTVTDPARDTPENRHLLDGTLRRLRRVITFTRQQLR